MFHRWITSAWFTLFNHAQAAPVAQHFAGYWKGKTGDEAALLQVVLSELPRSEDRSVEK